MTTLNFKTTQTNTMKQVLSGRELNPSHIKAALEAVDQYIKTRNLQVDGDLDLLKKSDFLINSLTLHQRKKIAKAVRYLLAKPGMKNCNLFLHSLYLRLKLNKVKLRSSVIEEDLDKVREEYKKLKLQTEEARLKYKAAKALVFGPALKLE